MKTFLVFGLFCGLAPMLSAQTPAQPTPRPIPPPGPLLNRAPEMAQWVVTSKTSTKPVADGQSGGQGQSTPTPSPAAGAQKAVLSPTDHTTTVIKTRTIRFEQMEGVGGEKIQKWFVPGMQVTLRGPGEPIVSLSGVARGNQYVDYSKTDFLGFEWISPTNFTGIVKVLGQDCLTFKDKVNVDLENPRGARVTTVACISLDSRLPVALQFGEETRIYQFGAAPTEMLVLPPKIETVVNQWRGTLRQAARPPAKP